MISNAVASDVSINNNVTAIDRTSFICCMGSDWYSKPRKNCFFFNGSKEGVVCEGLLEKKIEKKRIKFGSQWKQKYCVLNTEAFLIYSSKTKMTRNSAPSRTLPLCHIKLVKKLDENNDTRTAYFSIITEQQESLTFRSNCNAGWMPQIQIQLIHYKVSCYVYCLFLDA